MSGKIFISYRREDSAASAGRLYDQLDLEFGSEQLFIDVDHIAAGADFVKVLNEQILQCDVLLAMIGKRWLNITDVATGQRRLENPDDFVRIEIEAALARDIHVIPVLVDGAEMPHQDNLPNNLKPVSRRNAVRLTHERFRADTAGLVKGILAALNDLVVHNETVRKVAEEEKRRQQELARLEVMKGLSPREIKKAEELANWEFIKNKKDESLLRDHLARFPEGVTYLYTMEQLENLVWQSAKEEARTFGAVAFEGFLGEFPKGQYSIQARAILKSQKEREKEVLKKEVYKEQEKIDWEMIKNTEDIITIKKFLKNYPDGVYTKEAWRWLRTLKPYPFNWGILIFIILTVILYPVMLVIFDLMNWSFLGNSNKAQSHSGVMVGIMLIAISVLGLIKWRRAAVTGSERAIYWFGTMTVLIFELGFLFDLMNWSFLGSSVEHQQISGWIVGIVLFILTTWIVIARVRKDQKNKG